MDVSKAASLPSLGLNSSWVTVSGLSSGGYFAVQMHVAYSKTFSGVGVFAGGPFFCAGLPPASVGVAQTACMVSPSLISVDSLVLVAHNTAATGTIDPLSNLKDDRVYVFSGTEDSVVHTGVVQKLAHYYGEFVTTPNRIKQEYDIAAEHCMPTVGYGNDCGYLGEPYINNCGYDAVGPMLQHIYDNSLSAPAKAALNTTGTGDYVEFSQFEFLDPLWTLDTASMYKTGVVYVPKACSAEESVKRSASGKAPCRLHVAFHGCKQTIPMIDSQFYEHVRCRWLLLSACSPLLCPNCLRLCAFAHFFFFAQALQVRLIRIVPGLIWYLCFGVSCSFARLAMQHGPTRTTLWFCSPRQ